jgi:DNA-binding SARP family transcriptional activator
MALLGSGDAVYLEGGGRFLARLEGREAFEAYAFRIPADHLDRLVRAMLDTYGRAPAVAEASRGKPVVAPEQEDLEVAGSAASGRAAEEAQAAPATALAEPAPEELPVNGAQTPNLTGPWLVAPPFMLQLFGGPRLLHRGRVIEPGPDGLGAKLYELLACIGSLAPGAATTAVLAEALWPGDDLQTVAAALRKARSRVRDALARFEPDLPKVIVRSDGDGVRLDATVFACDVHQFLALDQRARELRGRDAIPALEGARALYRGDLMASGSEATGYRWLDDAAREALMARYRALHQEITRGLARLYAEEGRIEEAIHLNEELLELDPWDEVRWRTLFRLYHANGDREGLIQAWEGLIRVLRQPERDWDDDDDVAAEEDSNSYAEVRDAEPEPETVECYQHLLDELPPRVRIAPTSAPLAKTAQGHWG